LGQSFGRTPPRREKRGGGAGLLTEEHTMMDDKIPAPSLVELIVWINHAHRQSRQAVCVSLEQAKLAGDLLLQAKSQVGHGHWLSWLEANMEFSIRTAEVYMRISKCWPQIAKFAGSANMSIEKILALLRRGDPREMKEAPPVRAMAAPETRSPAAVNRAPTEPPNPRETLPFRVVNGDGEEVQDDGPGDEAGAGQEHDQREVILSGGGTAFTPTFTPKPPPEPTPEEIEWYIQWWVDTLTGEVRGMFKRLGSDWPKVRRAELHALIREQLAGLEEPAPDRQAGCDQSARESSGGR
jgi:hypothetical protein